MGCNCKNAAKIEKALSNDNNNNRKTAIKGLGKFFKGTFSRLIVILLVLVLVPIVCVVLIFSFIFSGKLELVLPKKLTKFWAEVTNGRE